ncbi:MAG: hypothetical protein VKK42_26520 [Lyngbya sp.]|nr:hypothetical protein [Lyngbya sp.]
MNKINLTLTAIQTVEGLNCQLLTIELKTGDSRSETLRERVISPEDLIELELPPGIDTTHKQEPFLQMNCEPWIRGNACRIPEVLLKRIQALIHSSAS